MIGVGIEGAGMRDGTKGSFSVSEHQGLMGRTLAKRGTGLAGHFRDLILKTNVKP